MTRYTDILKEYWGYPSFRSIQLDIIESICQGRDTLGLMPTGGGKSITFQVPALAMEGTCLVITPLIALMKDQVAQLRKRGIQAAALHAGMSRDNMVQVLDNASYGGVKLLYISPERLSTELFQKRLHHLNVSFIAVDEAHCISQWGYDFRPSYLQIADFRCLLPGKAVLALTATAPPRVVEDIQEKLHFSSHNVFSMSFERSNLAYIVRHAEDKLEEMRHILQSVEGAAIVYTRSRQKTKETADFLNAAGLSATFYHAGLEHAVRNQRQQQWKEGRQRIMVATNAFGMGIDKADVRMVIHIDTPDSLEAYFQEAGRAGRDGKKAYAVLLCNDNDKRRLAQRIDETFPDKTYIKQVYDDLAYHFVVGSQMGEGQSFAFDIDQFCFTFKHFPTRVIGALATLQRCGYLQYDADPDTKARFMFTVQRNELNRLEATTPFEERVILFILRNYPGLFTRYINIDEGFIATQTDLDTHQVYVVLRSLAQRGVASFIPRRKTPYITYTCERVKDEDFAITPQAYDELKERYIERITAMVNYMSNDTVCRSRQLLHYFGEERSHNCGQCDVCHTNHKKPLLPTESDLSPTEAILQLLSDGKPHALQELNTLPHDSVDIDRALQQLMHEERIDLRDNMLVL